MSLRPIRKAARGVALSIGLLLAPLTTTAAWQTAAAAQSAEITIEVSTNGADADAAPGPTLDPGESVTWQYLITVNGPTTMYDVIVSDTAGATPSCDVDGDGGLDGTHIHPGPLEAGQSFSCTATGLAKPAGGGTYSTTAKVRAFDFDGVAQYEDSDQSHYTSKQAFVANPNVSIQSLVNGVDADTSPGPYIAEGSTITWSYIVTNAGNVPLSGITVTTTNGVTVDCGSGSNVIPGTLASGATATCSGSAPAALFAAGLQTTAGSVGATAVDPGSGATISQLSAQDPHNYTPVMLPEALAFTGPSEFIATIGFSLAGVGVGLWATGRIISRRRPAVSSGGSV